MRCLCNIFEIDKTEWVFWPNQFGGTKEEYLKKINNLYPKNGYSKIM
jgi:hypothetical protein